MSPRLSARLQVRPRYVVRTAAIALAALMICGPLASAQQQPAKNQGPANALQGFSQNRDQPVKIVAATLEVREKDKVATFSGDVKVIQGDTEMRCRSLVVHYEEDSAPKTVKAADPGPGGQQQISRIEAKGNVVVTQKDQNATGDNGTFDMRANTVTLTGNVVVTRGQDVLRGRRLVVNLTTGTSKMDGAEALFQQSGRSADPLARSPEKR